MKRTPIKKKTRFEVFKRDGFTCQYCGATPPEVVLHVDHIIAVVEGGGNGINNLITACESCNLGKGATPLDAVPKSLKLKTAEIVERREQLNAYTVMLQAEKEHIEADAWRIAAILSGKKQVKRYDRQDFRSITHFLEKLPFGDVEKAAEMAFDRGYDDTRTFKYFCGICWAVIREGWK